MHRKSPSPRSRQLRKSYGSPLPLSVAVYLDECTAVLGLKQHTFEGQKSRLPSKLDGEKKRQKATLRGIIGRMSCEKQRPESEFRASESFDFQGKYENTARKLEDLQRRCAVLCRTNEGLKQTLSLQSVKHIWSRETTSSEVEELYTLLSNCHHTLRTLIQRKEQVEQALESIYKETGVMKYARELEENMRDVKAGLLTGAVEKRNGDQVALSQEISTISRECEGLEGEIETLTQENSHLAATSSQLESACSPESLHLAELYEGLCITTALLHYSQTQVTAWEAFIRAHAT